MSDTTIWAQAKAEINQRGWYQGWYCDPNQSTKTGPVCLAGAVNAAYCGNPNGDDRSNEAGLLLRDLGLRLGCYVSEWNDAEERNLDEVYALLDLLDAEEQGQ